MIMTLLKEKFFDPALRKQYISKENPFSDALEDLDSDTLRDLVFYGNVNPNQPIKNRVPSRYYKSYIPRGKRPPCDNIVYGEHPLTYLSFMASIPENTYDAMKCADVLLTPGKHENIEATPSIIEYHPDYMGLTPADYSLLSDEEKFAAMIIKDKITQDMAHNRPLFFPDLERLFLVTHMNEKGLIKDWAAPVDKIITPWLEGLLDNLRKNVRPDEALRNAENNICDGLQKWAKFQASINIAEAVLYPHLEVWQFITKDLETHKDQHTARDIESRQAMECLLKKPQRRLVYSVKPRRV